MSIKTKKADAQVRIYQSTRKRLKLRAIVLGTTVPELIDKLSKKVTPSISEQLAKFLRNGHGFVASGDLQRIIWRDKHGNLATPSNISRRLRELAADGVLQVQIRRGHAYYAVAEKQLSLLN